MAAEKLNYCGKRAVQSDLAHKLQIFKSHYRLITIHVTCILANPCKAGLNQS
jgi:hypothetical protein